MNNPNEKEEEILDGVVNDINNMKMNEEDNNQQYQEFGELNEENGYEQKGDQNHLNQQNIKDNNIDFQNFQFNKMNMNKYNEEQIIMDNNINPDINNINEEINNQYYMSEGLENQKEELEDENNINNIEQPEEDDQIQFQGQNFEELDGNINNNEYDENLMLNDNEIENEYIQNDIEQFNNNGIYPDNQEINFDENNDNRGLLNEENNIKELNDIETFSNNNNTNNFNNINEINELDINNTNNMNIIDNFNNKNNMNMMNNFNNVNEIDSLKLYIINLEQKCNQLQNENKLLKINLKKTQSKINNRKDPNYEIVENSIRQGTILLEDVKRKNYNLKKKIKSLENQNQQLNYKLIETNQKLKRLINDKNNPILQNINQNNNNNLMEIKTKLSKLNNKIDESDIIISKLKFDKKTLEMKLEEAKLSHENELKLMLNYKNSELSVYQKTIDNFKKQNPNRPNPNLLNNNNFNIPLNNKNYIQKFTEYENKISTLSNELSSYNLDKKRLENKINSLKNNLIEKDNTINGLNKKIIETEGNFNLKLLEIQQFSDENKEQFDQLLKERDELLKKNQELSNGLIQFDNKVKEANLIFINKTEFYNKSLDAYKNKITDYKSKISILKKKINELYLVIEKMKLKSNHHNFEINKNLNNFYHKNLTSTPGPFNRSVRGTTPFSRRYFKEKDDISLYNVNKINNISLFDDNNIHNTTNVGALQGIYNGKKIDINNGQNNNGDNEYKLDYSQKQYLENYKSFLSGLDYQLNS